MVRAYTKARTMPTPTDKPPHITGPQLKAWRTRMRLNIKEACKALGVPRATYTRWEKVGADKRTALACAAISMGIPEVKG